MYCRNCGKEIDNLAVVCVGCGVPVNRGYKFCNHCGAETSPEAAFCIKCGRSLGPVITPPTAQPQEKSRIAAGLLGIFLGVFGVHRFYLGYTGIGVAQLVITVVSCGLLSWAVWIWGLIEGIMILSGGINQDAQGRTLRE